MGYARTKATVYAVFWPEINVVKVGISNFQRWRPFVLRGGVVLGLMDDFNGYDSAGAFETACHLALERVCKPAFATREAATPYLGMEGAGWLECFCVPGDLMSHEILPFIDTQLEALHAQA